MSGGAPPLAGGMQRTLTGATLGFFVGFASVSLFGPTAQLLDEGMRMTSFQLAFLVAMPSLSGSLLRIPFGAWVDANGGRRPFLILLVLALIGMLGVTLLLALVGQPNLSVAHYPLLVVCALLSGCGIATFSVGIGQVSYWYPPERQGWALGAFAGFGNIAPGLFSLLVPLAIGAVTITGTYLIWALMVLVGLLIYAWLTADAPYFQFRKRGYGASEARRHAEQRGQELFPAGSTWTGLAQAARLRETWVLVFLYFTSFGGFLALTAWFPTFWQSYFGYSLTVAGALTMTYSVLASLIRVPAGVLADRIGGVRTVVLALTLTLAGAVTLALGGSGMVAVAGMLALALGMGTNNAGVFTLVPRWVDKAIGGAAGWVGGLGALGGFLIPPLMAAFVELQGDPGYARGFSVLVVLCVASLFIIRASSRRRQPRLRPEQA